MNSKTYQREIQKLMNEIAELLVTHHGGSLSETDLDFGIKQLNKAFKLAQSSHAEQKRKSGEPYLFHPLRVAHLAARHWMSSLRLLLRCCMMLLKTRR